MAAFADTWGLYGSHVPQLQPCAAVPGDRLRAEDGTLLINDEPAAPLPEEGVRPEYLTGGEFTVPEGSFFLLGDNLEHSIDSRYAEIGLAEERGMVGKVLT